MNTSLGRVSAVAGLALVAAVWWRWPPARHAVSLIERPIDAVQAGDAAALSSASSLSVRPVATHAPAPAAACASTALRWQIGALAIDCPAVHAAFSDSGSRRRYRIDGYGSVMHRVRIESVGQKVQSATATSDGAIYACRAEGCRGISIGPADLQGVRRLVFDRAVLNAATAGADLVLNGTVEVAVQTQRDEAVCAGQRLSIARSDGTLAGYCPDDGTGRVVRDDGGTSYRYADLDGRGIAVELDAQGRLQAIASGGMACRADDCAGVTLAMPDGSGARRLRLDGTMLQGAGGWMVLDGQLTLPE
ncbi:MAG: hypothetical protein JSR59_20355 [Proteobacteria bacterium]|nr:hypothetical protein [Pseudomonadota bacterium]